MQPLPIDATELMRLVAALRPGCKSLDGAMHEAVELVLALQPGEREFLLGRQRVRLVIAADGRLAIEDLTPK